MSEFQIILNWSWFLFGILTSLALEIIKLREGQRNWYYEKWIANELFIDRNKVSWKKISFVVIYAVFGGLFVMILDPNNVVTALIIGATWDKYMISLIEGWFQNDKAGK